MSIFPMSFGSATSVAILAEHFPTEFEHDTHYLRKGVVDVEPVATLGGDGHAHGHGEEEDDHHKDKRWGEVIASSFIVNIVTLIGVITFVPGLKACMANRR